jgi:DNA-binding MarR family transcriptional regulator
MEIKRLKFFSFLLFLVKNLDDLEFSILFYLQEGAHRIRTLSSLVGLPMSTIYRKIGELEERNWINVRSGKVSLSEKAVLLLKQKFEIVVGVIHVEHQMLNKIHLKASQPKGWEHQVKVVVEISESEGLDYAVAAETAAYLYTGYQAPSACIAYIQDKDKKTWIQSLKERGYRQNSEGELADVVLLPICSVPQTISLYGVRCVSRKRVFLEGLSLMGRGLLDSLVISKSLGERIFLTVPEELTDVVA